MLQARAGFRLCCMLDAPGPPCLSTSVRRNMRPIRPERAEHAKIKRAFRAATFMKWCAVPFMGMALIVAGLIRYSSRSYAGLVFLLLAWGGLLGLGYATARCPRCGQVWWSKTVMFIIAPWLISLGGDDETDSFTCRRCGLDIGYGLRE